MEMKKGNEIQGIGHFMIRLDVETGKYLNQKKNAIFFKYVQGFQLLNLHKFHQLPFDNQPGKEMQNKK